MLTVRRRVHIQVPVEEVFAYMDEPTHQTEITPSLTRSELVERVPNGGARVAYTYRILGMSFSGEVRATDYVSRQRIVWAMSGDLRGTIRWYFATAAASSHTQFTYSATYALPGTRLLHPLLRPLVRHYNEREVVRLLECLRAQVEGKRE